MVQMSAKNNYPKNRVTICFVLSFLIVLSMQNILFASEENKVIQKTGLKAQDTFPEMTMKEYKGKEISNKNFSNWVSIYTFGDRKSNEPLMDAMYPPRKEVLRKYPSLNVVYFNIADVQAVPGPFRYLVDKMLKLIVKRGEKQIREDYEKEGLPYDKENTLYYMVPDWDGAILKTFKLKNR